MSFPASLPQPSLRAYPFMSLILSKFDSDGRCDSQSLAHIDAGAISAMASEEQVDGNAPPRFCPQQGVDGLLAISDETLGRLSKILNLRMDLQTPITSKAELAAFCAGQEDEIVRCFEGFTETHTPEQAHAWHLSARKGQLDVHWGALADLYNASQDDQKQAISDIFGGCFGYKLEALYTAQPPDISLSAALMPVIQVEQRNGYSWCFNDAKAAWQRDDVNQGQFLIEGRADTNFDGHALIATASTFDEALALSTVYTKGLTQHPGFSRISITECESNGTSISELQLIADLKYSDRKASPFSARLSWNLDKLERLSRPHSVDAVFKTLLRIEKIVGVKWAQACRLENDLGM